jgi:hypothetical protein
VLGLRKSLTRWRDRDIVEHIEASFGHEVVHDGVVRFGRATTLLHIRDIDVPRRRVRSQRRVHGQWPEYFLVTASWDDYTHFDPDPTNWVAVWLYTDRARAMAELRALREPLDQQWSSWDAMPRRGHEALRWAVRRKQLAFA